ncbi:LPS O-antigen chain length determinant protein WzzB [Pseudomonas sp. LB3P93]
MLKARSDIRVEDEVDLVALVKDLWLQKFIIIGVAVLVAALVYAYASISIIAPIYEAKLYIVPPTQSGIAGFNAGRSASDADFKPYTVNEIYAVFTRNLEAESFRQDFFKEFYLPSLSETSRKESVSQLYKNFSQTLVIGADKGNPPRYSVAFQSQNSEKAAALVKAYVERVKEVAKAEIILNITRESSVRAHDLEKKIVSMREAAPVAREDRINQLREALRIAESIGLTNPQASPNTLLANAGVEDESLAYRRGSKALQAEINVLQSRTSYDAFIPDLRKLQSRLEFYNTLSIDPASVSVGRQDGDIAALDTPVKNKKKIIVLAGIVGGLALGILIALMRIFFLRSVNPRELMVREDA